MRLAEQVVRRHRLAERFLTDILGLSWAEAHQEAGKWEHVISEPVEAAINRILDNPTTCPHGNPIPGSRYEAPDAIALCDLGVGGGFTVSRIPEELEFTPGLLEFLEDSDITPVDRRGRGVVTRRHVTVRMGERASLASARSPATASWSPATERCRRTVTSRHHDTSTCPAWSSGDPRQRPPVKTPTS